MNCKHLKLIKYHVIGNIAVSNYMSECMSFCLGLLMI